MKMDDKNISKSISGPESGDTSLSISTTLHTDWSISSEPEVTAENVHKRTKAVRVQEKVTRQVIERKELLHTIQLLKIELSQKNLMIDNIKVESATQIDDLEEKLSDCLQQRKLLQAKLEAQNKINTEETRHWKERTRKELESLLKRQQQLELRNARLEERAGDVKQHLRDLSLTDSEYFELKGLPEEQLSLKDFAALKLCDAIRPMRIELQEHRDAQKLLERDLAKCKRELELCSKNSGVLREDHATAIVRTQKLEAELTETRSTIRRGDYKTDNYDRVESERAGFERQVGEMEKRQALLDATLQTTRAERDDLLKEVAAAKQSVALLKQDKDYLTRQTTELTDRGRRGDERLQQALTQLEGAKVAREEAYEKLADARERCRGEYEGKLREELETMRVKTSAEVDRLRSGTREFYERENRSLREARDESASERDRSVMAEKEASAKYEQLLAEHRQAQVQGDVRASQLQQELRMKTYDLERTQLVHDETVRDLSASRIDHEKLLKKTEVLKEEYHRLEVCAEGKVTELEGKLCEAREKLDAYEKLERELDDVIVQAAEVEDEREAERVMFAYGYGANVPSTAKRRMQQSVYLARRVLQLERANASLRREAERKEERERELSERVTRTSTLLLQEEEPPCGFLAERLRTRDDAVHGQRRRVATLEEEVRRLTRERDDLAACKNRLSADLERLLQQRDDIAALRRAILDLQRRLGRQGDADASSGRRGDDTGYLSGWESGGRVAGANGKEEEEGRRSAPITFTIGKSTVDRHGNKQPASVPTPGAKASKAYSISYS